VLSLRHYVMTLADQEGGGVRGMHPTPAYSSFLPVKITASHYYLTGNYNAKKNKVKQQLQIRHFKKILYCIMFDKLLHPEAIFYSKIKMH